MTIDDIDYNKLRIDSGHRVVDIAFKLLSEYEDGKLGSHKLSFYLRVLKAERSFLNSIEGLKQKEAWYESIDRICVREMQRIALFFKNQKRKLFALRSRNTRKRSKMYFERMQRKA